MRAQSERLWQKVPGSLTDVDAERATASTLRWRSRRAAAPPTEGRDTDMQQGNNRKCVLQ